MKRVFISQPMNGLTDLEISIDKMRVIEWLYSQGFKRDEILIIDSYTEEHAPENVNIPLWFLGSSIKFLATADIVVFAKGWKKASGCLIENKCAVMYGLPIFYEEKEDG